MSTIHGMRKSISLALGLLAACAAGSFAICALPAFAGSWQQSGGSWYYEEGGQHLTGWHWIDGDSNGYAECYYFGADGIMKANTTVDGYQVDASGAWTENGWVKGRIVPPGVHFPSAVDYASLTPAEARMRSVPEHANANGIAYHGRVYQESDYGVKLLEHTRLDTMDRCLVGGCLNPRGQGSYYCDLHRCMEPGCKSNVFAGDFNCGFCTEHMTAHGISWGELSRKEQEEAHAAALAATAAKTGGGASAGKSGGSTGSSTGSSSGSSSGRESSSKTSSGSSSKSSSGKNSSGSGASSGSGKTYYDSYDDGYHDVLEDEDYDWDRYRSDSNYAAGVDDAMDEEGWDW